MLKFTVEFRSLTNEKIYLNDKERKILAGMLKDVFNYYMRDCLKNSIKTYIELLDKYRDPTDTIVEDMRYVLSQISTDASIEVIKVKVR